MSRKRSEEESIISLCLECPTVGQLLRRSSTAVSGLREIQASAKLLRQPDINGEGGRGQAEKLCVFGSWVDRRHKVGKGRSKVPISHARGSDSRPAYF